jgi:hypothetical protein
MMRDLAIENFNTPSSAEEIRKQLHAPNRMLGVLSDWDLLQPVNAPRIIGLCEEALGYVSQHLVSEERAEAIDKASRVLKQHNGLSFKKQVDDVNGELCYLIRGEGARLIADSLEGMPGVLLSRMAGMVMAQPTDAQGFAVLDGLYGLAGQVEKPHAR